MNVLLAEDHHIIRNGLRMLLEVDENIQIIQEAKNGLEVLELLDTFDEIDVVLSDIDMPLLDGISLTKEMMKRGNKAKIIILSMHESDNFVHQAFIAGASGYLLKSTQAAELIFALKHVYAGGSYLSSDLAIAMIKRNLETYTQPKTVSYSDLGFSSRELEVLQLIAEGLTNQQMSDKLFLSKRTIEGHRQSLIVKTKVNNTAGLICFAMRNGIIQ